MKIKITHFIIFISSILVLAEISILTLNKFHEDKKIAVNLIEKTKDETYFISQFSFIKSGIKYKSYVSLEKLFSDYLKYNTSTLSSAILIYDKRNKNILSFKSVYSIIHPHDMFRSLA